MNAMFGIDRHFALSGLGLWGGIEPRALPWAIACRPFGAGNLGVPATHSFPAPTGHDVKAQGNAKRRPGYAAPHTVRALKGRDVWCAHATMPQRCGGCFALSGLGLWEGIGPRALPWAIACRPFGAGNLGAPATHSFPAPTGHDVKAQGRAKRRPGYAPPKASQALKGRNGAPSNEIMAMLKEVV